MLDEVVRLLCVHCIARTFAATLANCFNVSCCDLRALAQSSRSDCIGHRPFSVCMDRFVQSSAVHFFPICPFCFALIFSSNAWIYRSINTVVINKFLCVCVRLCVCMWRCLYVCVYVCGTGALLRCVLRSFISFTTSQLHHSCWIELMTECID